jgi:hypothetical protein
MDVVPVNKTRSYESEVLLLFIDRIRIHHESSQYGWSLKSIQAQQCGDADYDVGYIQ